MAVPSAAPAASGASVNQQLAKVKQAAARYHDVAVAEGDGYVSTEECVFSPDGTMGIHYVNFALLDDVIEAERPEILVYIPSGEGLRLVAVEWLKPDADHDLTTDDDRPFLFGQPFNGPMEGHEPAQPREFFHYDLHAWVWQANPAGMFEDWNSMLSCPAHGPEAGA